MQLQSTLLLALTALALAAPATEDPFSRLPSDESHGLAFVNEAADGGAASNNNNNNNNNTLHARARESFRVRYCEHANGKGAYVNQNFEMDKCYGFMPWWNDRISSIYVNIKTYCFLYKDYGCGGIYASILIPRETDLKKVGMNDKASSIRCTGGFR